MRPELLSILQHTLGLDRHGQGPAYRNHFVGARPHDEPCEELVRLGYMERNERLSGSSLAGGGSVYHVTPAGEAFVRSSSPQPPKLTRGQQRYRSWIEADVGDFMSFGEWLRCRGWEAR